MRAPPHHHRPETPVTPAEGDERRPLRIRDENETLRAILQGTATHTGERFFESLVENLSRTLGTYSAWVTEYLPATRQLRSLAFWVDGRLEPNFVVDIEGTPCAAVVQTTDLVHYPDNIVEIYPQSDTVRDFKAASYMGAPLLDPQGRVIGNLAVLDRRPMPAEQRAVAIFKVFANRAAAELQREKAERALRRSEAKYRRIIETTDQAFLLLDRRLQIADVNAAFARLVGRPREAILGRSPLDFADAEFRRFLEAHQGIPGGYRLQDVEGALLAHSRRTVPVRIQGDRLQDDDGRDLGFMYFLTDITSQKRSLQLAAEVQRNLLPKSTPRFPGVDLAGRMLSCDDIGGDYFDYLPAPLCAAPHLDVIVGDVSGHGVEAALLMATARAFLRTQVQADPCRPVARVVTELNRELARDVSDSGRFMTLFYLRLDLGTRRARWVRAGHPPAQFFDTGSGRFRELGGPGVALGMDPDWVYTETRSPGPLSGVLALGTDGVWETRDRHERPYGKKRLREVIRRQAAAPGETILERIFADVTHHALGAVREDDITLVVAKLGPGEGFLPDYQI